MTTQPAMISEYRSIPRSVLAVLAGLFAVAVISLGTDQLFHELGVYPPWGQPMPEAGDNALALAYRTLYGVLGGYITARLAPNSPLRHALVLGFLSFVLSTVGAYFTIVTMDLGPDWYPLALVIVAIPATMVGGLLYQNKVRTL